MAKQNFIAGGYYGKLGETVGQRWKNKRTLRVYVIPHDPKTPAQERNRAKFGQAVPYAQLGMQFNARAPAWDSETITEWQGRMSVAKIGVDNGVTGLNLIPIFPSGYTPYAQATRIEAIPGSGNEYTLKMSVSEAPATGRTFSVYAECTNTETGQKEGVLVEGISGRTIPNGIDIELPGHTLAVGDMVLAVSNDDRTNEDKMFYVPPMPLSPAEIIVVDDWTVTQIAGTRNFTLHSEKMKGILSDYTNRMDVTARDVIYGNLETEQRNFTFAAGTGTATITYTGRPYTFGAGCEIGDNGSTVVIDGTFYRFPNVAVEVPQKLQISLTDIVPTPAVTYHMTCYDDDDYSQAWAEWKLPKGSETPSGIRGSTLIPCQLKFSWFPGGTPANNTEDILELVEDEDSGNWIWYWNTDGFEGVDSGLSVVDTNACQLKMSAQYADITLSVSGGIAFSVTHE